MAEQINNGKRTLETPNDSTKITLCLKSQDDTEVYYRFRGDRKIYYLLREFCKGHTLEFQTVVFLFDGRRVNVNRTPLELGMEDGDTIDVMLHQLGGCPIGMYM